MQITRVTSEALQATIRRLLPSQQGFGEDLQASNVILPIIDLTPTAEGSQLPTDLQTALSFDDLTSFDVNNTTTTLVNSTGFWRFYGSIHAEENSPSATTATISISNGLSSKVLLKTQVNNDTANGIDSYSFDFVVVLESGHSVSATTGSRCFITGVARQLATLDGTLINPSGYSAQ